MPVERLAVLDEFAGRLWIKSNRPGVQLAARIVMPRTQDPASGTHSTTIVAGPRYRDVGRWELLTLTQLTALLADQVRVLRAASSTNVDSREAYVDAIVLIVPGGPGGTAVWTDALDVDGVLMSSIGEDSLAKSNDATFSTNKSSGWRQETVPSSADALRPAAEVELRGATLTLAGHPFLPRAIEWNGERLALLATRGFNTVWTKEPPTADQSVEAAQSDLWFICTPPRPDDIAEGGLDAELGRVLAWHLGTPTATNEVDYYRRWAESVRESDPRPGRPILIAPRSDWLAYSRIADVLIAEHPAGGRLSESQYTNWLKGLRLLARPGTPFWAIIPTQFERSITKQVSVLSGTQIAGVSVDQRRAESIIRAASVNACHGFLFQTESRLDSGDESTKFRAQFLERANRKLELIEPFLTLGKNVGQVVTMDRATTATMLQVDRARLLVPSGIHDGESFASGRNVAFSANGVAAYLVPGVSETSEAFQLSPAELGPLRTERVAGGTRINAANARGMVLIAEDPSVAAGYRHRNAQRARQAAELERDLAIAHARMFADRARQLGRMGVESSMLQQAVDRANAEIGRSKSLVADRNAADAYRHAASARRILAEAAEDQRRKSDRSGVLRSTPFAVSSEMVVLEADFEKSLATRRPGENQLLGGGFEDLQQLVGSGWRHLDNPLAGVACHVELSPVGPYDGRNCLVLSAGAVPGSPAPEVVGRPLVRIVSPPIHVSAKTVIEITGWVRVVQPITGSIDGLEIVDSLGGPELGLRLTETSGWQPFQLIRGVPETGDFTLEFSLTGLGTACLDGVTIRPLSPPATQPLPAVTADPPGPIIPGAALRPQPLFDPPARR